MSVVKTTSRTHSWFNHRLLSVKKCGFQWRECSVSKDLQWAKTWLDLSVHMHASCRRMWLHSAFFVHIVIQTHRHPAWGTLSCRDKLSAERCVLQQSNVPSFFQTGKTLMAFTTEKQTLHTQTLHSAFANIRVSQTQLKTNLWVILYLIPILWILTHHHRGRSSSVVIHLQHRIWQARLQAVLYVLYTASITDDTQRSAYSICNLTWATCSSTTEKGLTEEGVFSATTNKYRLKICKWSTYVDNVFKSTSACTNKQSCGFKHTHTTCHIIPHSSPVAFKHFMKLFSCYACRPPRERLYTSGSVSDVHVQYVMAFHYINT